MRLRYRKIGKAVWGVYHKDSRIGMIGQKSNNPAILNRRKWFASIKPANGGLLASSALETRGDAKRWIGDNKGAIC